MNTHRNLNTLVNYGMHYKLKLINLTDFDNLLAEVVSELIHHNIAKKATHRINQRCDESRRRLREIFKLLLNHSATSLVVSEFFNLIYYFKLCRGKKIQIHLNFI
jgi:hypothetical protein